MTIHQIEGDLFTCGIPVIAHGCNAMGSMGAGIAVQFRSRWPRMYERYRQRCASGRFRPGSVFAWDHEDGIVFNLGTQYETGGAARTWMIAAAVGAMIGEAAYWGVRQVALPEIGCGIGGLALSDLMAALAPYADAPVDLTVVSWKPGTS
jgi:O-acetyl-ADP-ribose deacetylase (regulator of RNase III)